MQIHTLKSFIKTPVAVVGVNTVVLTNQDTAVIFDPSAPVQEIQKVTVNKKVIAIFLTHGHWDHIYTLKESLEAFDCPYYLNQKAIKKVENYKLNGSPMHNINFELHLTQKPMQLKNNGIIKIGDFEIEHIQTPGHSDCSLTYKIGEWLICGDVLRLHKLARLDLPTASAQELKKSIEYFNSLPQDLIVYNGHEEPDTLEKYLLNAKI